MYSGLYAEALTLDYGKGQQYSADIHPIAKIATAKFWKFDILE